MRRAYTLINDDGEIILTVTLVNNEVRIGVESEYIYLDEEHARDMGRELIALAEQIA